MIWLCPLSRRVVVPLAWALGILFLGGLVSCYTQITETPPKATSPPTAPEPDLFEEVTAQSADLKKFRYKNGEDKDKFAILESLGGGVGVIDFDGDGLLDLVFTGGGDFAGTDGKKITGYPTRIFKNLGNWTFQDVTDEVLPPETQALFYSHGVAVCDYNRDGWPDLLVTGYGRVALYRNESAGKDEKTGKEKRKFVDVTKEAGLLKTGHFWASSAAFGDLDGDGWPDLYVCQYADWSWENNPLCPGQRAGKNQDTCSPKDFNAKQHALYRNTGKGGFVEVTKEAGLRVEADDPDQAKPIKRSYCGKGLGVLFVDVDDDGRPDIYVANDTTESFLYLNHSNPGKIKLEDAGKKLGVNMGMNATPNGSMGVDAGDIDGSNAPALIITNFESELYSLFRMSNAKTKEFYFASYAAGLGSIGKTYVGWGTGFVDIDNDGWMDLVMTNGHAYRFPSNNNSAQKPVLFLNMGGGQGKFVAVSGRGGAYFRAGHRGRGLAIADLNNDGLPDLIFNNLNESPAVLKNSCSSKNRWLGVLLAAKGHADTVGAKAMLQVGERKLTQFQKGGGSYLSARDGRLLFGLGKETKVGPLTVYWPSGEPRLEHFDGLAIDRYHKIEQGEGKKG